MVRPFFEEANVLREIFEHGVGPARTADPHRFVWDYWHVPGQYTYLRTPARRFFPADVYGRFLSRVRTWGRVHLGCDRISEPWLSYYVDGCRQELHADVPQGPWSFVYSLTRWQERRFTGGETVLLRDTALDYWTGFDGRRGLEADQLIARLPAHFDQLLVFDARVPHGVATVEGTMDPLESRVVLHGWFVRPTTSVQGTLRGDEAASTLAVARLEWAKIVAAHGPLSGLTVWRLVVLPDGRVGTVDLAADTLVRTDPRADGREAALAALTECLSRLRFPVAAAQTSILLPLDTDTGRRTDTGQHNEPPKSSDT